MKTLKHRLIKLLLAVSVLGLASLAESQTNVSYLSVTNMTIGTAGGNDFMLFYKWNGSKYVYNRQNAFDFYAGFTNSPAGLTLFSGMTNAAYAVTLETAARVAHVNQASNSLQTSLYAVTASVNANYTSQNTAIGNEVTARGNGDSNLTNRVNAVEAAALSNLQATNAALNASISAVSAGLGNAATNGGKVTLAAVVTPPIVVNLTNTVGTINIIADLSAASFQVYNIYGAGGATVYFWAANISPGQNVTVFVRNLTGGAFSANWTDGSMMNLNASGAALGFTLGANGKMVASYISTGTTASSVLFSAAPVR